MVETKYSRTISLTGSSIEFLKPHRQQQSIKMKHISQNDMVISFWFYSNKTTKLAIKQKTKTFNANSNIGHNNKNETNGKSETYAILMQKFSQHKKKHSLTHKPSHWTIGSNGGFTAFDREQHFSCRTQRHK